MTDNDSVVTQMQFRMAFKADRPREPDAVRDNKAASALLLQGLESPGKSLRAEGDAIPHGSEVREHHFPVGNGGKLHLRHVERNIMQTFALLCAREERK